MGNKKNLRWFERYILKLNDVLLWMFIVSMVVIALIYIFNIEKFNYEIIDNRNIIEGADGNIYFLNQTSLPAISIIDWEIKKDYYNTKALLAFICILGWMAVHPKFKKNLYDLFKGGDRDGKII